MSKPLAVAALFALSALAACGGEAAPNAADTTSSAVGDAALEELEENAAAVEDFAAGIEAAGDAAEAQPEAPTNAAIGTSIGDRAPAVTTLTTSGEAANFDAYAGAVGTVLIFTRSADWCPYCQEQLIDMNAVAGTLAADGWGLTALSYDTPDILSGFGEKHGLDYPLLSDTGSETIKRWGLLNASMEEGTRFYGIPHPTIAYIGADGTLLRLETETDYKIRPSAEDVVETARAVSAVLDGQ